MATNPNAICEICNKPYYKCSKCNSVPHYKAFTCSPECYQIREVLIESDENILSDEEAAKKFERLGITIDSNLNKYSGAKNSIKTILEKGATKVEKPKKSRSKLFE